MGVINSVEQKSEIFLHENQDITGKASTSLLSSSTASHLDQGSINGTTLYQMGELKKCSDCCWYYMFLRNSEIKQYIDIFTGKTAVRVKSEDKKLFFQFKVFPYTTTNHRNRFEKCDYNKKTYEERKEAAYAIKEAFSTGDTQKFIDVIDKGKDDIKGDGYLFVCAPQKELNIILANTQPQKYLVTKYNNSEPVTIPDCQMQEFIYLYESMPYNIEMLEHPLEEYVKTKKKIRITGGVFKGKEGYIMRLHRNSRLVFSFGNMTIAINDIHAFPFEKVD